MVSELKGRAAFTGGRTATCSALVAAVAALWPGAARALEVEVSSTTSSQVYEVRGRSLDDFLRFRRVTERLGLRLARVLPREGERGYDGPRLSVRLTLRVDTDFGSGGLESRPSSELWYVPGYDPYGLDLMVAELVVSDLFGRTTDLRAGRLLTLDPTGFGALDGLEARVRLPGHVELRVASGLDVVAGQHLSSGTFEVDGVVRARRDGLDPDQRPEVEGPATRVVVAAGASLVDLRRLSVDLGYRLGVVPEDGETRTSYHRLAGAASFVAGPVQGGLVAGGDLALGLVDEVSAELAVRPLRWLLLGLGGRYDAPVFDTDSIFVAFWAEPAIEGDLRVEVAPVRGLRLGLVGAIRDLEPFAPEERRDGRLRYTGEGYARLRLDRYRGELRARAGEGFGGRRVGVDARFAATLPGERVVLDLRGTLLGLRRDLVPNEHLVSLGYVAGARYRMSEEASITFELEHNYSRSGGQQLRFLALLDLGFWI